MFGRPPRRPMRPSDEVWLSVRALAAAAGLTAAVIYWALVIVD